MTDSTDNMVERVARAIAGASYDLVKSELAKVSTELDDLASPLADDFRSMSREEYINEVLDDYEAQARAAIEAMREPTDEMVWRARTI